MKKKTAQHEMESYIDSTLKEVREGEIIKGRIVKIGAKETLVDIGLKSEGIIPLSEFMEKPKVGDEVEVVLEDFENEDGFAEISKQKADLLKVWNTVRESHETGKPIEGRIAREVKGGLTVDLFGVEAFLPGSQVDIRPVENMTALIGETCKFKIVKMSEQRKNIVVSRRAVAEEEMLKKREKLLKELSPGQIREGIVKSITDFGAFIDLGGIDGLLHIADISWTKIAHPSEALAIGDKINIKIIDVDRENERVSLGMKQLTPHPWENIEKKYPVDSKVRGRVVSLTEYGAFVEIEKGIEGLIHISEMSWSRRLRHPSQILAVGDTVEIVVLNIDRKHEKISLGLKQTLPNPWDDVDKKYPVGSIVAGKVRGFTNFGAFVELEDGVEGLIHVRDFSWTKRIEYPSDVLRRRERIKCKVLAIDKENHRISLGLKQLTEDPFEIFCKSHSIGDLVEGKIATILDKGIVVDVGIDGFVPFSHLVREGPRRISDRYKVDETLKLKLIEMNEERRKVILSEKEYLEEGGKKAYEEFMKEQKGAESSDS